MHPPIKTQADVGIDDGDEDTMLNAADEKDGGPAGNKDTARQEHKNEADINYYLSQIGVQAPRNAPTYGEWDDNIELQTALEATREAKTAYGKLPKELKEKFTSIEQLLTAVENGSLVIKDDPEPEPAPPA